MKEIQEIIKRIADFAPGEKAILATVVDVVGSGYRRAGARMLIDENGYSIGTVSGGCLEADVLERAKKVLETGEPTIITYDTTNDENSVFGLSMGCRGVIRVLLEPFEKDSPLAQILQLSLAGRFRQFVATMISSSHAGVGSRLYCTELPFQVAGLDESVEGLDNLLKDGEEFFVENRRAEVRTYQLGDGSAEFLFENINPPLNLLLFGAGFDALPVVKFAKEIGWRVTVVDHRPAFANRERLPEADEIFARSVEDLPDEIFNDANTAAVILTHNYNRDLDILPKLLNSNFQYIGALGPKTRTEKLIAEIREAGKSFNEANLAKLHAPIGLDIGSESPEEIALAIVAEIKTVLSNKNSGFLRDK